MKCPFCASTNSRVIDTRSAEGGIRRRRECEDCGRRFTTYERVAPLRLMVIKQDGRREPFDRDKILSGIQIACAKRRIAANGDTAGFSVLGRGTAFRSRRRRRIGIRCTLFRACRSCRRRVNVELGNHRFGDVDNLG